MGEKSPHAVGRGIFQIQEAKTMGPDDSNESRHSLPMGVGNDKRVDRKKKSSSDCSVNVSLDPRRKRDGGTKLSFQSTDGNQEK